VTKLGLVTEGANAREEIRNILFNVFVLNKIMKLNPSEAFIIYFLKSN